MPILDLQKRANRQIGVDRRYVQESIAAEWAMQHARKVRDLVYSNSSRPDDLGNELGGLVLLTLCVANQYNVNLPAFHKSKSIVFPGMELKDLSLGQQDSLQLDACSLLVTNTTRLVSTLAYYHGWSLDPNTLPLGETISEIHRNLVMISHRNGIDLEKYIERSFRNAKNDVRVNRLTVNYHPSTSEPKEDFRQIKEDSVCVFAKQSYAWGARIHDSTRSFQTNLLRNLETFARFTKVTEKEEIDAFVFSFPNKYGDSIKSVSRTVKTVLEFFSENDPALQNSIGQIDANSWRFSFNNMQLFVQSFAPCYGSDNTRFSHGSPKMFIQFVSEAAFHRATRRDADKWQNVRNVIRKRASDGGQPYDVQAHDALTYVHPMRSGESPVRWQDESSIKD